MVLMTQRAEPGLEGLWGQGQGPRLRERGRVWGPARQAP